MNSKYWEAHWFSLLDAPAKRLGGGGGGALVAFRRDCLKPTKGSRIWACEMCRLVHHPECVKRRYWGGKRAECVDRAVVLELRDAFQEMQAGPMGAVLPDSFEDYLEQVGSPLRDAVGEVV